jgi:probable addiction module antidote protein
MTTKKKRRVLTIDYKELLFQDLQDLDEAAGYLTAALEEGEDVFLLAIRDVAQAHGGMTDLSKATDLNRENLYDMLSKEGNPRLSSLTAILDKLGLEITFKRKLHSKEAA